MENRIEENRARMAKIKKQHVVHSRNTVLFIAAIVFTISFIIIRISSVGSRPEQGKKPVVKIPSIQGINQQQLATAGKSLVDVVKAVTADQVLTAAREYNSSKTQTKSEAITIVLSHIKSTPEEAAQLRSLMESMLSHKSIQALADEINKMGELQFRITFPVYKKMVVSFIKKTVAQAK